MTEQRIEGLSTDDGEPWRELGTCSFSLLNVADGEHETCGAAQPYACTIAAPKTCRHPSFGEDPHQCGIELISVLSAERQTLIEARAAEPHWARGYCLTAENEPEDDAQAVNLKAEVLISRAQRFSPAAQLWSSLSSSLQPRSFIHHFPWRPTGFNHSPVQPAAPPDALMAEVPWPNHTPETLAPQLSTALGLLYERHGDLLRADLAEAARSHWLQSSARTPDCGHSAPAEVTSCQSWGPNAIQEFAACSRLLSDHVSSNLFDRESRNCLALMDEVSELPSSTEACVASMPERISVLQQRILAKRFAAIRFEDERWFGVFEALEHLEGWYLGARRLYSRQPERLTAEVEAARALFWSTVRDAALQLPAQFPEESELLRRALLDLSRGHFAADREVLRTLLRSDGPVRSELLLALVGDGLSALEARLSWLTPYYDLSCSTQDCTDRVHDVAAMWQLLATSTTAETLSTALEEVSLAHGTEWEAVFLDLRDNLDMLDASAAAALRQSDARLHHLLATPVPMAEDLVRTLSTAAARWRSYRAVGLLDAGSQKTIHGGLHPANRERILQDLIVAKNALEEAARRNTNELTSYAQSVLEQMHLTEVSAQTQEEIRRTSEEAAIIADQLLGAQELEARRRLALSAFLRDFLARARLEGSDAEYRMASAGESVLSINAGHARFDRGFVSNFDIAKIAIQTHSGDDEDVLWTLALPRGTAFEYQIRGDWAPNCALRELGDWVSPGAETGPEGYWVTASQGTAQLTRHESSVSESDTHSFSRSICAGVGLDAVANAVAGVVPGLGATLDAVAAVPVLGPLLGGILRGSGARACLSHDVSRTTSASEAQVRDSSVHTSASMASGLRAENTPFPSLPAGSLLLVEMLRDPNNPTPHVVRDIHVLKRQGTILLPQDSELYLVVNDRGGCDQASTSSLELRYRPSAPVGTAAERLTRVMGHILEALREKRDAYVAQGSVSPSELEALRTQAYDDLFSSCGAAGADGTTRACDLDAFPPSIRSMFSTWISDELASLDRQVNIGRANRDLGRLLTSIESMMTRLTRDDSRRRFSREIAMRALQRLDTTSSQAELDELLYIIREEVLPWVDILHPEVRSHVQRYVAQARGDTLSADWTSEDYLFLRHAVVVADGLVTALTRAERHTQALTQRVALLFPRPLEAESAPIGSSSEGWYDDRLIGRLIAARENGRDLWIPVHGPDGRIERYDLAPRAAFSITPEDIYGHGISGLPCNAGSPLIQSLALYIVTRDDSGFALEAWNGTEHRASARVSAERTFVTSSGNQRYRMGQSRFQAPSIRVLAGRLEPIFDQFTTAAGTALELVGTSPFAQYEVDLTSLLATPGNPASEAIAVAVVMNVEKWNGLDLPSITEIARCGSASDAAHP